MSSSNLQVRRATVDDLVDLRRLWRAAGLPVASLEKQLTDFQIVETADGILLGALALQIEGQQGRFHSETCGSSELAAEVRLRLWERAHAVARNYGLYRLWIDEETSFWKSHGFEPASPELQKKLPASLGEPGRSWFVLQLRNEVSAAISVEHEFELFTRAQRESSDRIVRQAQALKGVAYLMLFAVVLFGLVLVVLTVLPGATWSRLFQMAPSRSQPGERPSQPGTNSQTSADGNSAPAKPNP